MSEQQAWTAFAKLARAPLASPRAAFDADLIARVAAGHGGGEGGRGDDQ
jgi:hypothetical protein